MNKSSGLAKIVKIIDIKPILNCDNIECVQVLGWSVVCNKKDNFKKDDLAIYFCIDTLFDPEFEPTKFLNNKPLKTKKIRNQISQGLLAPLTWLNDFGIDEKSIKENDDVTNIMKVKKYVHSEEKDLYKEQSLPFSLFVPKTDEIRFQNFKQIGFDIEEQDTKDNISFKKDENIVITQKYDGSSATYIYNENKFSMCSRNFTIEKDSNKVGPYYTEIEKKYNIEKNLTLYCQENKINIALQGEIYGDKINSNRMGISKGKILFAVFNIYDIDNKQYLNYNNMIKITEILKLETVKLIYYGKASQDIINKEKLMELAESQKYESGNLAEGIVIKSDDARRISFKVISNKYLLKYNL